MPPTPPRVIDRVVVGDAPEGLAISPKGNLAVAVLLRGSNQAWNSWFYNRNGSVVILKIDGKKVTKIDEIEVRGLPEGVVWSADGKYLAAALHEKQRDEHGQPERDHIGLQRRRRDLQPLDRAEHRDRRRDDAVPIEQCGAEHARDHQSVAQPRSIDHR